MRESNKKVGVGFRHAHFPEILEGLSQGEKFPIGWFEAISENFINTRGRPFEVLMKVREHYEFSLHGVSLNIASHEEINFQYLEKLKQLYEVVDPFLVSDHLCWTGGKASNLHNLLPFPYSEENLVFLSEKVLKVQDFLKRPLAFENLSAYFSLNSGDYTEAEFLRELSLKTDCKILLDINNVFVNSENQKFNPYEFLDTVPLERVSEIHLAGHTDQGDFLFDTHSEPVCEEVWNLYQYVIEKRQIPTLIEWDENIPSLNRLFEEAEIATSLLEGALCEA